MKMVRVKRLVTDAVPLDDPRVVLVFGDLRRMGDWYRYLERVEDNVVRSPRRRVPETLRPYMEAVRWWAMSEQTTGRSVHGELAGPQGSEMSRCWIEFEDGVILVFTHLAWINFIETLPPDGPDDVGDLSDAVV